MIFLKLVTFFLIYSFLGWCIESIYKSIGARKLVNSGFLNGPFCPIYGYGAVIMYFFLEKLKGEPVLTFCLGFVILSVWEYFVGVLLEKVFHTKYWDYSHHKYNLQGRVCLTNSIFWGVLSVVFIEFIHPIIENYTFKLDTSVIAYIDIVLLVIILIDTIISILNVISISDSLARVQELNDTIKEKLEELKIKGKNIKDVNIEGLQLTIDKLKKRRNKIILKSYRKAYRLKKAFPTIKSENITAILNQKIENFKKDKK